MSPESIVAISQAEAFMPSAAVAQPPAVPVQSGFGDIVSQGLSHVNEQLKVSQTDLQQLAVGNVENLHQVMIRLEESRTAFQLMLQVRGRLLEAYQDVLKMQV